MNIFKHPEQEFPKKKEDAGFHLHLLSMKGVKITVLTNKSDWSWAFFLEHGLFPAKVFRYIESSVDSHGVECVVKDFTRP